MDFAFFVWAVTGFVGNQGSLPATIPGRAPIKDRAEDPSMCLGPVIVISFCQQRGRLTCQDLRCEENFACVRIFHWRSRWKTEDLDVTGIRRERTDN
jgi:hypothetical protein